MALKNTRLADKLFGVYDHALPLENSRLMQGFTDSFPMPVSRYTFNKEDEITAAGLSVLARSDIAGVGMVRCPSSGDLYVLNHLEYDADTLAAEYFRDANAGLDTALPVNYFPGDDPACAPVNSWRPFAYLLMANWLNDLYRDTPYALESLQG